MADLNLGFEDFDNLENAESHLAIKRVRSRTLSPRKVQVIKYPNKERIQENADEADKSFKTKNSDAKFTRRKSRWGADSSPNQMIQEEPAELQSDKIAAQSKKIANTAEAEKKLPQS